MAVDIKMPQLSDTMYSGKILVWKVTEGTTIKRGDILAEVETDKANLEIEAFHAGTLLQIRVPAGTTANVGDVIAVIGDASISNAGEKISSVNPIVAGQDKILTPNDNVQNQEIAKATDINNKQITELDSGSSQSASKLGYSPVSVNNDDKLRISPLAKKVAAQRNISVAQLHDAGLQGSGPNGRIIKKDLEKISSSGNTAEKILEPSSRPLIKEDNTPFLNKQNQSTPTQLGGKLTPFSKMRSTIARRMQESVTTAPHFYLSAAIDMTQAKKMREVLKENTDFQHLSVNHLVIKASAYAIKREPRVNNCVKEEQIYEPAQINIGIITAIDDGLLIPVIKEVDKLSLKDVVFEARSAVERARAGRPNSSDLTGGTFSISNLGMYKVENFTAIINPGQGSILAVSSILDQAVVRNGQVVAAPIMNVTISVDHRIIDGVMAGNFIKYFRDALENPVLLMI